MSILISGVLVVVAFVAGVLVGRANPKKVEKAVDEAKKLEDKAKSLFK